MGCIGVKIDGRTTVNIDLKRVIYRYMSINRFSVLYFVRFKRSDSYYYFKINMTELTNENPDPIPAIKVRFKSRKPENSVTGLEVHACWVDRKFRIAEIESLIKLSFFPWRDMGPRGFTG